MKIPALVHTMRHEAPGILSVEFRPLSDSGEFPAFDAGAHIDLHLPNGLVRSYSLCNPPGERHRYVVAVLHEPKSRGGSACVHQSLRVGQSIDIAGPRNLFALDEAAAHSVLVCGGIGVTPILAMLHQLRELGRSVELVYCARSRRQAAFTRAIEAFGDGLRVHWHFDDECGGPPDLQALLAGRSGGTHFYACGPSPMLDSFERACAHWAYEHVHLERFGPATTLMSTSAQGAPDGAFELVCRQSDRRLTVSPEQSILDALIGAGLDPAYSCRDGVCGACETAVSAHEGELVHRDSLLSPAERAAGNTMLICVSRCTGRLVLDI
jgi:ferredoxin-NADP reductase